MLKKNDLVHYFRRYERFKICSSTSLKEDFNSPHVKYFNAIMAKQLASTSKD